MHEYVEVKVRIEPLKKVRSHMIVEAMQKGTSKRVNLRIDYVEFQTGLTSRRSALLFIYRDVLICSFDIDRYEYTDEPTDFDHTIATQNQRRLAIIALEETFDIEITEVSKEDYYASTSA